MKLTIFIEFRLFLHIFNTEESNQNGELKIFNDFSSISDSKNSAATKPLKINFLYKKEETTEITQEK